MTAEYLDFNSTNPLRDEVVEVIIHYLKTDFGNAGSRTHLYGQRAKSAVYQARKLLADSVDCRIEELIFTSGATESNNIAILGLKKFGHNHKQKHILSTSIEHKSVLAALEALAQEGFEVEYVDPQKNGRIDADDLLKRVRADTLLVSVMGANNETGAIQPIEDIAEGLESSSAYFHVDASQSFLKARDTYLSSRIDMLTLSSHKIGGPKGIGALITRRRRYARVPLEPIFYGGGQERGLRPGTLPVALIAGFAKAVELMSKDLDHKLESCRSLQQKLVNDLGKLNAQFNCDPSKSIPTTVNFSIPGIDSEAAILALKSIAAVSNGSACTSEAYEYSHVLTAAKLPEEQISGAVRISWGLETDFLPNEEIVAALSFERMQPLSE